MRSYGHSFLRGNLNRIMVMRIGSMGNAVEGESRARNDRVKKKAMTKKKWADHHLVARLSLLLVLAAFVKWSGTSYDDESIDSSHVSRGGPWGRVSPQSRRRQQRQQPQDHRRVMTSTTGSSSKSLHEAIASATSSSYGRDVVLQFSLGKVTASNAEEQEEDRVTLFRAVESALLRVLCRRSNDEAASARAPVAVVSGDTLDDAGSDMCAQWGRRSNVRRLGQGLGKQPRRKLQGDNNSEGGAIPAPNVFALVNGTLDDDGDDNTEKTHQQQEAVVDSANSPYASDYTVVTGRVSRWRLQDTLLSSADDEEDGTDAPLYGPYYYTVWTVHYPVLQLGDYYWEQQLQFGDGDALENGASEEHLAVYTYDDDASAAAAAGVGGSENRTGSAMALDLLRRELQHQVNVAIRNSDFDRSLRQGRVTTYRASVVGREPAMFATEGGAGTSNTSNGAGTSRQIALAVLYGLAGLIAGAVLVLLGCYLRRMRAVRRSCKETKAKVSAKKGNAGGGSTYDSTFRHTDDKGADGRSITSASSFLHADHDDDPGYCWIPIPNIVRTPTSSYADTDSSSRGWLHSQDGDFSGSCSDPLMVLMETDDDEDDDDSNIDGKEGDGVNNMDILDDEASLLTTFTAASVTTVEVDVDTCQVVNPSPPKRVRFDPSLWTEEIPNHPGQCATDADDAGSVSSLSDAAGAASDRMDCFDALPPVSLCGGSADVSLGLLPQSSFVESPGETASPIRCVDDGELLTAVDPTPQRNAEDCIGTMVTPATHEVKDPCVVKATVRVRQGDVAAGGLDERQMVTPS
jgi:hypothetical protein